MDGFVDRLQPKKPRIALWVESFYTEGHISLVERLARSLKARGAEVLILGDEGTLNRRPLKGLDTFQLPSRYADNYGEVLKQAILDFEPQIFVTELIPFGYPSIMSAMVQSLYQIKEAMHMRNKPYSLVSWTRDLPDADPTIRHGCGRDKIEGFTDIMDAILVQGDKDFLKHPYIEKALNPFSSRLRKKTHYMGYPVPQMEALPHSGEVVVVAGGGFNEGQKHHFHQVLDAMPYVSDELRSKTWRMFVSTQATDKELAEIHAKAEKLGNVVIEPTGPAFKEAQASADMLVTQGGMTSVECAALGRPTCIVPHTTDFGYVATNQYKRAEALEKASGCVTFVNHLDAKKPEFFAQKLEACYASRDRQDIKLPALNGHEKASEWLMERCRELACGASIAAR